VEVPSDVVGVSVVGVYTGRAFAPSHAGCWVREHVWPKSWGFADDGADNAPYSDAHALFAAEWGTNSARGNRAFVQRGAGEQQADPWTEYAGGNLGTGSGPVTGRWQPREAARGRIARAMMYMDTRYDGREEEDDDLLVFDLRLTDDASLIQSTSTDNYPIVYGGLRSSVLAWAGSAHVTMEERYRNEWVSCFQGNRNVFVDQPGLACERYGGAACGPATTGDAAALPTCNASRPAGPDEAWCTAAAAAMDGLWEAVADRADLAELLSTDHCPGSIDEWATPCLFATGERAAASGRAAGSCGSTVATLSTSGGPSALAQVASAALGVGTDGLISSGESVSVTFDGMPQGGTVAVTSVVIVDLALGEAAAVACATATGVDERQLIEVVGAGAGAHTYPTAGPTCAGRSIVVSAASDSASFALAGVALNVSLALPPPQSPATTRAPQPNTVSPTDARTAAGSNATALASAPSTSSSSSSSSSLGSASLPLPLLITLAVLLLLAVGAGTAWWMVFRGRRASSLARPRRGRRASTIRRTYASVAAALATDDDF